MGVGGHPGQRRLATSAGRGQTRAAHELGLHPGRKVGDVGYEASLAEWRLRGSAAGVRAVDNILVLSFANFVGDLRRTVWSGEISNWYFGNLGFLANRVLL